MQDRFYAEIEGRPRPTLFAASGLLLLAAVGLWVAEVAAVVLGGRGDGLLTLLNALYYPPFVLLPVALYMRRRRGLSVALRLNPMPVAPVLTVALLALLSVYAASLLTLLWQLPLEALGLRLPAAELPALNARSVTVAVLTVAAVPAVCEELLFRGVVLSAWETRGTGRAIAVSAALFALMHGNLAGLPAYLLIGGISGFLVVALDSLYAGVIYHTVYNAACLVLSWRLSGSPEVAAPSGLAWVLAAAAQALAVGAMMAMALVAIRLRARRMGFEPIPRVRRPLTGRERAMLAAAIGVMVVTTLALLALANAPALRGVGA